jgi:hypothetical protein
MPPSSLLGERRWLLACARGLTAQNGKIHDDASADGARYIHYYYGRRAPDCQGVGDMAQGRSVFHNGHAERICHRILTTARLQRGISHAFAKPLARYLQ